MKDSDILKKIDNRSTGIGSVPHTDVDSICDLIIEKSPEIPYWPQFANIDARESMLLQYSENLPCLKLNLDKNDILYNSEDRDKELLKFYEMLTSNNIDYFRISPDFARGFYTLLEKLKQCENRFIKGQVTGAVTFLYSIIGEEGKSVIYDDNLSDAIIRGLAMKAVWQAKEIRKFGKLPIIFFDEPSLSGFGSAFMSLEKETVISIFNKLISTVREHDEALLGIHCCGNSDWEMLLGSGIDILNFDSYGYVENFVLYPASIKSFLERGGIIAWGAVPTSEYSDDISLDDVYIKLKTAFNNLEEKGIKRELLKSSLFTPSCGLGTLDQGIANEVIKLNFDLAQRMKDYCN
ncbi:MAG: hypothetical protein SVR08_09505 [Spirochaetota bacterium]|nr:hypothetical protein [Spirochaetota bacterium]